LSAFEAYNTAMNTAESKSERIATRVTPTQKELISKAAALSGRSLTEFIIDSAQREAEKTIEKGMVIRLALENQIQLFKTLSNPPDANENLKQAAQFYDESFIINK